MQMQTYLEYLKNKNKQPKNKMWWIKKIQTNPILTSTKAQNDSGNLILD
jgi:hypothetical protein